MEAIFLMIIIYFIYSDEIAPLILANKTKNNFDDEEYTLLDYKMTLVPLDTQPHMQTATLIYVYNTYLSK
jgi:hypothetical protein